MDCLFCRFSLDKNIKAHEYKGFYYIFDESPVNPGHLLVIPKKHTLSLLDLHKEDQIIFFEAIIEWIKLIKKSDLEKVYKKIYDNTNDNQKKWFCKNALLKLEKWIKFQDFNHGINDWKAAWRTVDHLHWHIIPRFEWDMEDPRGGVRYVIPQMWNYKTPRPKIRD